MMKSSILDVGLKRNKLKEINIYLRIQKLPWQVYFALIILLGLGLRLYQLGRYSFWVDEVGVAQAEQMPGLDGTIAIVKSHAMAMPLDYITGWMVARVCTTEICLRMPSVIWGTLTLLVSFYLFSVLTNTKVALFACFFLALSPFHIRYSQELRFYASMVFFYVLTTYLLWKALSKFSIKRWFLFVLSMVVGVYFHVYVIFTLVNGALWLVFSVKNMSDRKRTLAAFFLSCLVILSAFLPGFLYFSPQTRLTYPFNNSSIFYSLLVGLGWMPDLGITSYIYLVWYLFWVSLDLFAIYLLIRRQNSVMVAWLASILFQLCFIIYSDSHWGYFVDGRQFLFITPFMCLLSSMALVHLFNLNGEFITVGEKGNYPVLRPVSIIILVGIFLLSYSPALITYYTNVKSLGREIAQRLAIYWRPGDRIIVMPLYDPLLYQYYLLRMGRVDISTSLDGVDIQKLTTLNELKDDSLLITPGDLRSDQYNYILSLGFHLDQIGKYTLAQPQVLWVRRAVQ